MAKTEERDYILCRWRDKVNANLEDVSFVTYDVYTDCHDKDYKKQKLEKTFYQHQVLLDLILGYPTSPTVTIDNVINCSELLTYIAVVRGGTTKGISSPLFMRVATDELDRRPRFQKWKDTSDHDILLTKDYLNFLIREHGFEVREIKSVFFYRKCAILPRVYQDLVDSRAQAKKDGFVARAQLLKNLANYSCGFFGFNPHKPTGKSTYRLLATKGKRMIIDQRHIVIDVGDVNGESFAIAQTLFRPNPRKKGSSSPLPLFVCIIEYGKLRMSDILTFFDKFLLPYTHRHLYTNVDNVIMTLSTRTLEDAVIPSLKGDFQQEKNRFFIAGQPGHLKQEWTIPAENKWRFVSALVQNWSVMCEDGTGIHKNSVLSNVTDQVSYDASCNILDKKLMQIPQTRRVQKMINMETTEKNFTLGKK
jgi:hypothetical protein